MLVLSRKHGESIIIEGDVKCALGSRLRKRFRFIEVRFATDFVRTMRLSLRQRRSHDNGSVATKVWRVGGE
jgi:hypothetical protein